MDPNIKIILPEIILSVMAMAILLLGTALDGRRKAWLGIAALASLIAAAALMPSTAPGAPAIAFSGMFVHDGFAAVFKMMFILAGILVVLVSSDYLRERGALGGEFYALVLFAIVGMMLLASAHDFMVLFVGIELASLATYVLVGLTKKDMFSNEAAIKYFLLSIFASAIMLFGISIVYAGVGTTNFAEIHGRIGGLAARAPAGVLMALVFLLAGFGFKVTAVPFHMYAPDVYQGAPTPVTIFLSIGPKAAAFAGLMRTLEAVARPVAGDWVLLLAALAVLTMTVGNVAAIAQNNVKRMLAYSSIAHSGYVLIGVAAMGASGVQVASGAMQGVMLYLFAYTIMTAGAFAVLMRIKRGERFGESLDDFSGLARHRPAAALAMLIFLLSLTGIPPTMGFWGKFYIFMSAIEARLYWLALAGIINVVISLFYYARIVMFMFMREREPGVSDVKSLPLDLALGAAAAATVVLGIFPQALLDVIGRAVSTPIVTGGMLP